MDDLIFTWVVINAFIIVGVVICIGNGANFSFVNPKVIYKNIKVNWFGAVVLTIIFNICLPAVSIPYWIYKLFTVGRK